jgi:hypothetical protein
MLTLRPGQTLNLDEPSFYIVLDGALRVATHEQLKEEQEELQRKGLRRSVAPRSTHGGVGGMLNKFKAAASTLITFRKIGLHTTKSGSEKENSMKMSDTMGPPE